MSSFLEEAIAESRSRVERWQRDDILSRLLEQYGATSWKPESFSGAIRSHAPLAIVAEIKRASPSRGKLAEAVDPGERAIAYVGGGAAAVSVLTEANWFGGSLGDLRAVRDAIEAPILRKDFLVDPYDLIVSRALGADAVLLIVACLGPARLAELLGGSSSLGLETLVEVHDEKELEIALAAGATNIGVNARNLRTLEVDVDGALAVLKRVPASCTRIFESGIKSAADVRRAREAGADAVLVGETLMKSLDPERAVVALLREQATR